MNFRLTFDIVAHGEDPSGLLERLQEMQASLVASLEEQEDTYGVLMLNEADPASCTVEHI